MIITLIITLIILQKWFSIMITRSHSQLDEIAMRRIMMTTPSSKLIKTSVHIIIPVILITIMLIIIMMIILR